VARGREIVKMRSLVIVGCGGFGREVADVVDAINAMTPTFDLLGFVDDNPSAPDLQRLQKLGAPLLGTSQELLGGPQYEYVLGIGSGSVRRTLDARFTDFGWSPATLMHPQASHGAGVTLGPGSVVCAGVRLTTNIRLGRHVHLNLNSTVGHDCDLSDYVTVNPLVAISGGVALGEASTIGTHAAILQNLTVGQSATVGGGALVVRDVPDDTVVKGVPAR
jgi:sugar O-acyltransferase (sialic acid O-acetyltransferase NeuD family)